MVGLFSINWGCRPTKSIVSWLGSIHSTLAQTTTYQQAQGQIAIGSGGLFGQGFNASNLLIPVRESDMIFTVIAEDFGFIGSVLVIALYLMLITVCWRLLFNQITSSTPIFQQVWLWCYFSTSLRISALWRACFLWLEFLCLLFRKGDRLLSVTWSVLACFYRWVTRLI